MCGSCESRPDGVLPFHGLLWSRTLLSFSVRHHPAAACDVTTTPPHRREKKKQNRKRENLLCAIWVIKPPIKSEDNTQMHSFKLNPSYL